MSLREYLTLSSLEIQILTSSSRVLYAWQNPGVPVDEVMSDILRVFHHPALRNEQIEIQRNMLATVRTWVDEQPDRHNLNSILSSQSVKAGSNHHTPGGRGIHDHGALGGHGKTSGSGSIWAEIQSRDLGAMEGKDGNPQQSYLSASQQPGTPSHPPHSPNFGYQNMQRPGSSNYGPPHTQGGYLNPNQQDSYQGGYQQQQPYGMPAGPPGGYQNAPYPGQPPYPTPGGWQGPSPGAFGSPPPPGPSYPGQYPQQPPYGQPYPPYPPGTGYGGY